MAIFRGPITKKIINGIPKDVSETVIVTNNTYEANGEKVLLVKDIEVCRVHINSTNNDHIIIKSLTNVLVSADTLIDEEFNEVELNKSACVEFKKIGDFWYILSSDGLKNS